MKLDDAIKLIKGPADSFVTLTVKKITSSLMIEKYLNKKVFLKTWVKVKKNWNTDSGFIQSLGVGGNYESK